MNLYESINNNLEEAPKVFEKGPQVYTGTVEEVSEKISIPGVKEILKALKPEVNVKVKIDEEANKVTVETDYFTAWDGEIPGVKEDEEFDAEPEGEEGHKEPDGDECVEEPKLDTKEEAIDFLIADENEAIDGYNKVLAKLDDYGLSEEEKASYEAVLNHIIKEEQEHIEELTKVLNGEPVMLDDEPDSDEGTEEEGLEDA